jgi:uncharacterized protein YceH (UPF0502 family)
MAMNSLFRRIKKAIGFTLGTYLSISIVLAIAITHDRAVTAQSTTDFRAEITNLRTRVSQLEREVRRLSQSSNLNPQSAADQIRSQSTVGNPPLVNDQPIGRSDPMFERLANLVIELKQEVRELEQRVVEVERQLAYR